MKKNKVIKHRKAKKFKEKFSLKNNIYYIRADDKFIAENISEESAEKLFDEYSNYPGYDVIVLGYDDEDGYGKIVKSAYKGLVVTR